MKRVFLLGIAAFVALGLAAGFASAGPRTSLAGTPTMKILVDKDGFYRVPFATLVTNGWSVPANTSLLHLKMDGVEVPFRVTGTAIEFYGRGLDTLYTDTRTYWLSLEGSPGTAMPSVSATTAAGTPSGTYEATADLAGRETYYPAVYSNTSPGAVVGNNIFGAAVAQGYPLTQAIPVGNADVTGPATLEVHLYGLSPENRTITVSLNGTALAPTINWSGVAANPSTTLTIPASTLVSGANNSLNLTEIGSIFDFVATDLYRLRYRHTFFADSDRLSFPVTALTPVSVGGFTSSNIRVFDITNTESPRELLPTISGTTVSVNPPLGTMRLYTLADTAALAPKGVVKDKDSPPNLKGPNQADFIVIAPDLFASEVQPLVNERDTPSFAAKLVDINDVYDQFGSPLGAKSPDAIKSFLQYTYTNANWTGLANPKPKYVLFAGDATQDPRGYVTRPKTDFIPTLFFDPQTTSTSIETPSDDAVSDFNSDGRPELAVGRLPVQTEAQMTAMVNKILNYSATAPRARTALLVADNYDRGDYRFDQFSTELTAASLTPNGVTATRLDRPNCVSPPQPNPPSTCPSDTPFKTDIQNQANAGPLMVNWFGHGSISAWTQAGLMNNTIAASLTNTNALSVYLMMTCQNGYFVDYEANNGLGESLLLASGGAVAVWASTGDTRPEDQINSAKIATWELFDTFSPARLGDAMLKAKNDPIVDDIDVLHSWVLLGDPTMSLNMGSTTGVTLKSFTGARSTRGVELRWATANEREAFGYNVYRVAAGKSAKVNKALIRAKRTGTAHGAAYKLLDRQALRGQAYTYRLQVVTLAGKRTWAAKIAVGARR